MSTEKTTIIHGVCLGHEAGVVVTAEHVDGIATAVKLRRFPSGLAAIAAEVRALLTDDPDSFAVVDRGLRGRELVDQIDWPRDERRRLTVFASVAEDRRYEIAGRLSHAIEARKALIKRTLFDQALRQALNASSREDAGDRPDVVALSLAVVDRRRTQPPLYVGLTADGPSHPPALPGSTVIRLD